MNRLSRLAAFPPLFFACMSCAQTPQSPYSKLTVDDVYSYATSLTGPVSEPNAFDSHNILVRSLLFKGWPLTSWRLISKGGTVYANWLFKFTDNQTETLHLIEAPSAGGKTTVQLVAETQSLDEYIAWFHAAIAKPGFSLDPHNLFPVGYVFSNVNSGNGVPQTITLAPTFTSSSDGSGADASQPHTFRMTVMIVR